MIKIFAFLAGMYALLCVAMMLHQRKLMYYPHTDLGPPEFYGLKGFEADTLTTDDGIKISYWYAPPEENKPTILYLHGNAGHLGHRSAFDHFAQQLGFGVMALSYRGFGLSQGSISEAGFYADAHAALKVLNTRYHTQDADIIVFGESIGSAVAMELARSHTFRFLALQAPFTSAEKKAAELYWWLPVKLIMWDKFNSLKKVSELTSPVLVMIGELDQLIYPHDSELLYASIPTRKKLVRFAHTGHNDFQPHDLLEAILDFERNER